MRSLLIGVEVFAYLSVFVVMSIQYPGIPNEKYAMRHALEQRRVEQLAVVKESRQEFSREHSVLDHVYAKAVIPFSVGFSIAVVAIAIPASGWRSLLIALGITVQLVAALAFDLAGISRSRFVSNALMKNGLSSF
jgi:hypothetical protein